MKENPFAIVDLHFAFETPDLIDRITETFADEIIWESPAHNLRLTNREQIINQYHKIASGIIEPRFEILRRFAHNDEIFDDRIIYFTAGINNVWNIEAGRQVKLRLAHYFKIKNSKICHEIGYEIIHVEDS